MIEGEAWRAAYNSGQPPFSTTGNPRTTWYAEKNNLAQTGVKDSEAEKISTIEGEAWRKLYNSGLAPVSHDGT